MGVKKLEDFNHDIEVAKEVLSSMPINNAKNLALYKNKVSELEKEYEGYRDQLFSEMKRRSAKYLEYKPSSRLELVKKELLDYKDLALFNPMNSPFEKMGFDTLLYSLTHYYKNDLASVNEDIKDALSKFELVGITLTENDFVYSNYARKYIKEFLKNDDLERMKDIFEDLHWKCPDVISHIETSFRILFNKHIKTFEKYIEDKQKEIIKDNLTYDDYLLKRNNLAKELFNLENFDIDVIMNQFMNGDLLLNNYSIVNVSKCYSKFLGDNCDVAKGKEKAEDFKNLYFNLREFKNYLKYSYVLDDVKAKYKERETHIGEASKILKEIDDLVNELARLTAEINEGSTKGFLFFKKKIDIDKHYLLVNEKVKELDAKYEEYDKALIYDKMNSYITDTSSVYDVFRFVLGFKGYLRFCIKAHEEDVDINKVKATVKDFEAFLLDPNVMILRNVVFSVDNDVAEIIMDHYKLLDINLKKENMTIDGVDEMLNDLIIIIIDHCLEENDVTIDFILDLFESKKLIEMYKNI